MRVVVRVQGSDVAPVTPVAIGGAEDKVGDRALLSDFVARAGGRRATIAIFPTASSIPGELAETYQQLGSAGSTATDHV